MVKIKIFEDGDSNFGVLNKKDLQKLGKSFLLAFVGFLIAFVGDNYTALDYGGSQTLVYAMMPVLLNLGRKFLSGDKR